MSVSKTLMHLLLLLIGLATYSVSSLPYILSLTLTFLKVLGVPVGKLTDVEFTESVGEAVGVSYWLRAGKSATTAPSTPITATRCLSSSSTCIFPPSGVISVGEVDELSRGYVTSPAVIEKAIPSEKVSHDILPLDYLVLTILKGHRANSYHEERVDTLKQNKSG